MRVFGPSGFGATPCLDGQGRQPLLGLRQKFEANLPPWGDVVSGHNVRGSRYYGLGGLKSREVGACCAKVNGVVLTRHVGL
jgi:hypothetical protein